MKIAINTLPSALKRERQKGLRVVTTAHDLLPPYLFPKAGKLRDWYTKRIICDADGAILTNAGDYHTVMNDSRGAWNPRAVFIPIGANVTPAPPANFDREIWRNQFDVQKNDMLLAYFGLLTHTKGIENILATMEQLPATTRLVLIGGIGERIEDQAYANAIRQLIAQKGLQERVIMTGHTEASDVSAYLIAADAVLLPFTDGYSYRRGSLITALAHGVPVITTHAPADIRQDPLPELIDGKHVLLVEPENTEQLVRAVQRIQQEPELRYWLARNGQSLTDVFSWERIVAQHEALYAAIR
jgi:glycosyltransferase involved in cell wall biosynthesis